jgi:hypothetical protein
MMSDHSNSVLVSVSMLSVLVRRVARHPTGTHPALWNFAEECRGVMIRLLCYVGALALIAIAATRLWTELPIAGVLEPAAKAGWSMAAQSYPAFAVSQPDSSLKIETYDIFRHPEGGRKDVMRWAASPGEKPLAELELYRPGAEASELRPPADEIAARMDPDGTREIAGAGIVDSKFGPVALFGFADRADDAKRCLGFMKNLGAANLLISGWSCQGESLPARRSAIACTLDRLILLTAANAPKLAELFAHAELKRGGCAPGSAANALSADWVTGVQNPRLRGSF